MIENLLFNFVPEWLFYSGIFVSILILILCEFESFFSFLDKYKKIARPICVLLISVCTFVIGYKTASNKYEALISEFKQKELQLIADSEKANVQIIEKYHTKIVEIEKKTGNLIQKVQNIKSENFNDYIDIINEATDE